MFIACDESVTAKSFLIGTIWLAETEVAEFEKRAHQFRVESHCWREFHFMRLRGEDWFAERMSDFVKLGLEIPELRASFIVADQSEVADDNFHDGSHLLRNLKFLYQLISRRYRSWAISSDPYIVFDDMTGDDDEGASRSEVKEAKEFIEKYVGKKVVCFAGSKSHTSSLVQLADVLTGAVAHRWRVDREGEAPDPVRIKLVELVEAHFGQNLSHATAPSSAPFNVWKFTSSKLLK